MGSIHELQGFWTSLITETGISPHVESLMKIIDKEERSLALMSRVFFLWCMGIKYQREDLENTLNLIRSILNKSSKTKEACSKCSEIKILLEKTHFESPKSLTDQTNISSKRRKVSDSPPQLLKKVCTREKENIKSSPEKSLLIEVLAPETEPFLQIKENVDKAFIIPETVPADEGFYGNTDFFNTSQDSSKKSPVSVKCNTSPILGKIYKPSSNSPATEYSKTPSKSSESSNPKLNVTTAISCVTVASPEKVKEKSPNKTIASPDSINNSPSLLGCNIINQIPILPCSKLSGNQRKNILHPLTKNIDSIKEKSVTPPSKSMFSVDVHSEDDKNSFQMNRSLRSTPLRSSFQKCKSEMGSVLSNRGRLSRLKSLTAKKDQNTNVEVFLDLKEKKKTYKQTKITKEYFLKQNVSKPIGEKCNVVNINEEDEEEKALRQAIEASLHSKEIEDILRKKHEELGSPKIKKNVTKSPLEKSIRKSPRTKCQKSLKFGSPSKGNNSKVSEEEVLAVLENDRTKKDEKEDSCHTVKDKEEDVQAKRKIRKKVFQDSFDMLPTKDEEPKYAYKGNVARKNSEKLRLNGWNCHECRDYYESKDLTEEQRKILQNKCSRHRSKYRPVTNTPEGFWNVGSSDEEET